MPMPASPAPAVTSTGIQIEAAAPPVSAVVTIAAVTISTVVMALAMRSVARV